MWDISLILAAFLLKSNLRHYKLTSPKPCFYLKAIGLTDEQAQERFGFLLNAFKYGVPPHGGMAYGLDRLVMLMLGKDSIKEVIAFPKVKDASCLMTEAPTPVDPKQLEELGIEVCEEAETTEE